jgi:hypothetical protein
VPPEKPKIGKLLLSQTPNLDAVAGVSQFFIRSGPPESIEVLLQALNTLDSREVAVRLLNSGNSKLEAAARRWLTAHGVRVITPQEFLSADSRERNVQSTPRVLQNSAVLGFLHV